MLLPGVDATNLHVNQRVDLLVWAVVLLVGVSRAQQPLSLVPSHLLPYPHPCHLFKLRGVVVHRGAFESCVKLDFFRL